MLAVQRPRMGSSKPPNQDMPFGYSFDDNSNPYPFSPPPAPAPGPSLLDDNESRFLDSFFDGVSSDQFSADFFSTVGDGTDNMGFGWQELPPSFMGTSSSFGQQPQVPGNVLQSMAFPDLNGNVGLASNNMTSSTTSPDVLAAATLLQNGHNNRTQTLGHDGLLSAQDLSANTSYPPVTQHPQIMPIYDTPISRSSAATRGNSMFKTYYSEMVFGPSAANVHRPKGASNELDFRWGSDAGFGSGQGFVAPANQNTPEAIEQDKMHILDGLEPQTSTAASTRPSSPMVARYSEHNRRRSVKEDDNQDERHPRKRMKGKMMREEEEGEDDEELNGTANKSLRRRRSKPNTHPASSPTQPQSLSASKRRKSTTASAAAAKASRENLTEDQKRENHIKSEQKRRTLIKEGFDDLGELVPDLRGGGFSKSAVLLMAGDWLEDLIKGNEILRKRLEEMENRR